MKKFFAVLCIVGLASSFSFGRDVSKKTGVGFNSQLSGFGVDSLSVRWWFSKKMAAEGLLGFSLGDDTIFNVGGKFLTVIKEEKNLNIYGFGIIGIESHQSDDTSFSVGGGFGTEFFFSDFPNLGFGAEIGLGFSNANNKNQFGTSAGWLSAVGIRYYL
ncbi:MAG: hypothetical protein COS68_05980 [Elusimicrobia bacterium CG06_land_8_20_14_3_00_38_11]|nr:MAG: hypothetical protein COS68_05980 [Elusimicrobia bacterium CG06_land_8_20_14_3_00_38_11]